MDENKPTILYEFNKNANDIIRFTLNEYRGNLYVDIRGWYPDEGGTMRPGKGVRFHVEHWEEFITGVEKTGKSIDEGV